MTNIHQYWVYVMANTTRRVIYIGITNDLYRRYIEHRDGTIKGFTDKYKCHDLIYFEEFKFIEEDIEREKELKGWKREKKDLLIKSQNPFLRNLAIDLKWMDTDSSLRSE